MHSTRLPRKMLLRETGKSLVQHTYEAARRARRPRGDCVATDHEEIAAEVRSFGGQVFLTSSDCPSGTDRIAELLPKLPDAQILVNVQGDEPELSGETIDRVIELLERHPDVSMATLATPIRRREQLEDPACVKVVFAAEPEPGDVEKGDRHLAANESADENRPIARSQSPFSTGHLSGRALYFSRSPIPHARQWDDRLLTADPPNFWQHIGLYAYRREFLAAWPNLPRSPLEKLESLEQLRALEAGHTIWVGVVDEPTIGIDTPADYAAFVRRRLEARGDRPEARDQRPEGAD